MRLFFLSHPEVRWVHFNPRTREGCDSERVNYVEHREVLIHAPVKGATGLMNKMVYMEDVLIHAPVKGATAKSYKIGNNFTVLFRKFVQKFDIVTFYISIF